MDNLCSLSFYYPAVNPERRRRTALFKLIDSESGSVTACLARIIWRSSTGAGSFRVVESSSCYLSNEMLLTTIATPTTTVTNTVRISIKQSFLINTRVLDSNLTSLLMSGNPYASSIPKNLKTFTLFQIPMQN